MTAKEFEFELRDHPDAGRLRFAEYPGYIVHVCYDTIPENPLDIGDCEPPLGRYYEGWEGPTLGDLWDEIPEDVRRDKFSDILGKFESVQVLFCPWLLGELKHLRSERPDDHPADILGEMLHREVGTPGSWSAADDYIDVMKGLCKVAGFACHSETSIGYSQGDAVRMFTYASPGWVERTGCTEEYHERNLRGICAEYGAWCWGDVFGISEIRRPDGVKVPDGSVCGFYGNDHKVSGLVDAARELIECDIKARSKTWKETLASTRKERKATKEAACRDIQTGPVKYCYLP